MYAVQRLDQLLHAADAHIARLTFQRLQRTADDDRRVVARELVAIEQLSDFHLDQLEQFRVVHHVRLVQEHDDPRYTDLA